MRFNQLQIAETLKINRVYVARLIREGKIKGQKVGRSYKVSAADLEKFLKVNPNQKFYTLQEVSEMLKVHRTFLSKLIHENKIGTVQIGRFFRIPESSIKALCGGILPREIFTIAELSKITNDARSNIVRAIQTNKLKAIKLDNEYRITSENAEEYFHLPKGREQKLIEVRNG